jgi:hypothetical protein
MKRKIASIAVTAIVLAACAGLAPAQLSVPRTTKVMVNADTPTRPLIWIDQEPIIVRSKGVTITWEIVTKGYEFPPDGIAFQDKSALDQFVNCQAKGPIFQCLDRNTEPNRFKYTIRVQPAKGAKVPQPPPLDPWVVNDR